MRRAKVDQNQRELVEYARSIGATVTHLHSVGSGVPDILIGYNGFNYLAEIKNEKGKLNALQVKWFNNWSGQARVIRTKEDINDLLNIRV